MKKFVFDYLLHFDQNKNNEKYLKKYYSLLIKNKIQSFNKDYDILSLDNIKSCVNKGFYKVALYLIKNLDKNQLEKIDNDLLVQIIEIFNIDMKKEIKEFLEILPNQLNNVINHFKKIKKLKDLLNILKYAKKIDEISDELANEIDEIRYEGILFNKFKRNYQEKKQYYSLIEFITKSEKYFNIFYPIFQRFIKKSEDENDIKVLNTMIDIANKKNFKIKDDINIKDYKFKKEDLFEYYDFFGPMTDNCLSFKRDQINVIFINNINDLKLYGEKYFKIPENDYIGFDSEWVDKINCKEKTETAIIQLSDYEGKNVLILDMITLNKDANFINVFKDIFTNKKIIGYDLKDDFVKMPNDIMLHIQEKNIFIDLQDIYRIATLQNAKGLSKLCEEYFNKPLCKYEQCSDWEARPLRESQLHYAALDAIYCCLLYKKLIEFKNTIF